MSAHVASIFPATAARIRSASFPIGEDGRLSGRSARGENFPCRQAVEQMLIEATGTARAAADRIERMPIAYERRTRLRRRAGLGIKRHVS